MHSRTHMHTHTPTPTYTTHASVCAQGPAGSTALRLAPNTLVDAAGSTWSAPPEVADAIQQVNTALRAYRARLAGACLQVYGRARACVYVCVYLCPCACVSTCSCECVFACEHTGMYSQLWMLCLPPPNSTFNPLRVVLVLLQLLLLHRPGLRLHTHLLLLLVSLHFHVCVTR